MIDMHPPPAYIQIAQKQTPGVGQPLQLVPSLPPQPTAPASDQSQPQPPPPSDSQPERVEVAPLDVGRYLPHTALFANIIVTVTPPTGTVAIFTPGFEDRSSRGRSRPAKSASTVRPCMSTCRMARPATRWSISAGARLKRASPNDAGAGRSDLATGARGAPPWRGRRSSAALPPRFGNRTDKQCRLHQSGGHCGGGR
jgi:hypothetical protein